MNEGSTGLHYLTSAILISVSVTAFDVPLQREGGKEGEVGIEESFQYRINFQYLQLYLSCCSWAKRCALIH